jgi:hypothetical protein
VTYHYLGAAHTAAEAVIATEKHIALYEKPDALRSDNSLEFCGEFADYLKKEDIKLLKMKPYNPKANDFFERYFRTLRKELFRRLKVRLLRLTQSINGPLTHSRCARFTACLFTHRNAPELGSISWAKNCLEMLVGYRIRRSNRYKFVIRPNVISFVKQV